MKAGAPRPYLVRSTEGSAKALIEKLKAASARPRVFAQALHPGAIASMRHLELAWLLAESAFRNGGNRARTLENEALLRAAATARIGEAIRRAGARSPREFVLLTDAKGARLKRLLDAIGGTAEKPEFKPDEKEVCALFGISGKLLENYSLEELVLEKVALSGA